MKIDEDKTSVAVDYWRAETRTDVDDEDPIVFTYPFEENVLYTDSTESIRDGNPIACYVMEDDDEGNMTEVIP